MLTSHSPEQKSQYAASTVNRKREAAERAKGWAHPLNLQEAKDAYRADSVSVWSRTSCLLFTHGSCGGRWAPDLTLQVNASHRAVQVQGAMGIVTTSMPSRMVAWVLANK